MRRATGRSLSKDEGAGSPDTLYGDPMLLRHHWSTPSPSPLCPHPLQHGKVPDHGIKYTDFPFLHKPMLLSRPIPHTYHHHHSKGVSERPPISLQYPSYVLLSILGGCPKHRPQRHPHSHTEPESETRHTGGPIKHRLNTHAPSGVQYTDHPSAHSAQ